MGEKEVIQMAKKQVGEKRAGWGVGHMEESTHATCDMRVHVTLTLQRPTAVPH
jgi:hypothetical protein